MFKIEIKSLLILLVLIWGVAWPITSIGLHYCPPIWYAALRLLIGTLALFLIAIISGMFTFPSKKDWPFVLSIGVFQIGFLFLLITLGLAYIPPGRSSIILYSYPFIAISTAVIFFSMKIKPLQIIGIALGVVGFTFLFGPWEMNWHNPNMLIGNGLVFLAAIVWAGSVIHIRYGTWHSAPHMLLPWQFLVGTIPVVLVASILVPHPVIHWNSHIFLFSLLYSSLVSTVLATWIMIFVSRELSVSASTITQLAVPVVALLASSFIVGEPLSLALLIAMGFILLGVLFVSFTN